MPQVSTRKRLLWLAPLACLLIVVVGTVGLAHAQGYQDYEDEQQPVARSNQRVRRQQIGGRVQVPQPGSGASPAPPAATAPGVNLQGGVQTGAMALSSSLDAQPPSVGVSAGSQARPPKVTSMNPQAPGVEDQPDGGEVVRPMRKKKKQPRVRPTKPVYDDVNDEGEGELARVDRRPYNDQNEDEYCDDGDDDDDDHDGYGHLFRPMRHMTRMMGSVMDQMQGMASNGGNFPAGSNMAMAQSMSNSDGYSRLSSVVNNNGRTRGIVSETRNGRTQTRRIGGGGEADDDQEEE